MELLYLVWPHKEHQRLDYPHEGYEPVWRLVAGLVIIAVLVATLSAVCALTPPA